ncbi:MAG: hypothetical protein ACOCV8_00490, partial [Spirochaetota bacterium]
MIVPNNERMILSEHYRKQVIRLRSQIQELAENSETVETLLKKITNENFYFENENSTSNEKNKNSFYIVLTNEKNKII